MYVFMYKVTRGEKVVMSGQKESPYPEKIKSMALALVQNIEDCNRDKSPKELPMVVSSMEVFELVKTFTLGEVQQALSTRVSEPEFKTEIDFSWLVDSGEKKD